MAHHAHHHAHHILAAGVHKTSTFVSALGPLEIAGAILGYIAVTIVMIRYAKATTPLKFLFFILWPVFALITAVLAILGCIALGFWLIALALVIPLKGTKFATENAKKTYNTMIAQILSLRQRQAIPTAVTTDDVGILSKQ